MVHYRSKASSYVREILLWDEGGSEWIVTSVSTYQDRGLWGKNKRVEQRMAKDDQIFERILDSVHVGKDGEWIKPEIVRLSDEEIGIR